MNENMNNTINEQELILRKKIEKREKFDIILAYILIVILLACIGIVLYLKFVRGEEEIVIPEEYVPTYISLSEISTSINTSLLANRYLNDGATFRTNVSGNSLVVTYTKDYNILNLNIPVVGNELEVTIPEDNTEVVTDIYKEITNIICVYYGNNENNCRNTIDSITNDSSISGVRFVNNKIYIDTTKSIDVNTEIVYNEVTKTSINFTEYNLNMLDTKIENIVINTDNTNIIISGTVERLTEDSSNLSVIVRLYDANNNLIGENKKEYNEGNPLNENSDFEIIFEASDTLKIESITEYSIEIVK